jgi:flagellar hook-length control protein FliK
MVNLGPPLKAMPDLKTSMRRSEDKPAETGPGSFEKVLSDKFSQSKPKTREETRGSGNPEKLKSNEKIEKLEKAETKAKPQIEDDKKEVDPSTQETVEAKTKGEQPVGLVKKFSERQKVMQKFMDSFESEFSIPPEKLVEAMAQLSDKDLLQSPEETAPRVIEKLDLSPMESEKAEAMYLAMVTQLSGTLPQVKDPEALSPQTKAALTGGLGASGFLLAKDRRQMLNDSLEQMNSRFFMKPDMRMPTEVVDPSIKQQGPLFEKMTMEDPRSSALLRPKSEYQGMDMKALLSDKVIDPKTLSPEAKAKFAEIQSQMEPVDGKMNTEELAKSLAELSAAAGALGLTLKENPENQQALQMEKNLKQGPTAESANFMVAVPMTNHAVLETGKKGQGFSQQEKGKDSGKGDFMVDTMSSGSSAAGVPTGDFTLAPAMNKDLSSLGMTKSSHVGEQAALLGGAGAALATGNKADADAANVQALMKQAQYMIKKGGGEATVQMSPEGMGQIHLKVMLNDGRVNLEMQTDNKEAKKLIESTLGDLKASLGVHKLAVDHVKVDVGNQLSSNSDQRQQEQSQFKQDPNREQARQFFNQFHEDNLSRRDGYYETSGAKAYSRTKPVQPLKPGDEASSSAQTRRYQGAGKGSGLDLVA